VPRRGSDGLRFFPGPLSRTCSGLALPRTSPRRARHRGRRESTPPPETPPTGDQTGKYMSVVQGATRRPSNGHSAEPNAASTRFPKSHMTNDREARAERGQSENEATHAGRQLTRVESGALHHLTRRVFPSRPTDQLASVQECHMEVVASRLLADASGGLETDRDSRPR
jgi:hypothetical protein